MLKRLSWLLAAAGLLAACSNANLPTVSAPDFSIAAPSAQGRYIVVFNQQAESPAAIARELAAAHGAEVSHVYRHALRGFAAAMSQQAAQRIA